MPKQTAMITKRKTTTWAAVFITLAIGVFLLFIKTSKSPDTQNVGTFSFPTIDNTKRVSSKVIKTEQGWGYEIYSGKNLIILQETIPGVPGNKSFQSKKNAKACGKLVVDKLRKNTNPSVSGYELDSLGIEIP